MSLPKVKMIDSARLQEILEKALIKAPQKELNELIWKLVLENLSKEDAEEVGRIVDIFFMYGIEFNIRPNFQIVGSLPAGLAKGKPSK